MTKLCLRHQKPYPCGRCRIESAQKPPQVAPASIPTEAANTSVPQAVSKAIRESLCAVPNVIRDSRGLKRDSPLRSLALGVVSSPGAPFGRDENEQPLKPMREDLEIAEDLRSKEFLAAGNCPHGNYLGNCLLCGTGSYSKTPLDQRRVKDLMASLVQHDLMGTKKYLDELWTKLQVNGRFVSYVDVLGIERSDLIHLLDTPAGTRAKFEEEKVLRSTAPLEERVVELKQSIAESEALMKSWSITAMKVLRAPDNIPDSKTRESWKREEKRKIKDYEREIANLRSKIKTWADDPDNYDAKLKTVRVVETLKEKVNFRMLIERDIRQFEDEREVCSVDRYLELLNPSSVTAMFPDQQTWRKWEEFENFIVMTAIEARLIRAEAELPRNQELPPSIEEDECDEDIADSIENILILKTGGGCIGASIYNFGRNPQGRVKLAGSFDNAVRHGNKDSALRGNPFEGDSDQSFLADLDSGELGSGGEE